MRILFALFFIFLLFSGCTGQQDQKPLLGLRFSTAECDADEDVNRPAEYMTCYHTAAVTQAYIERGDPLETCRKIWTDFKDSEEDDDTIVKAELVSNTCYYDVALIKKNKSICTWIGSKRFEEDPSTVAMPKISGEKVTHDRCIHEAERLAEIAPERYYESNPDNICALVFVLPALLLISFIRP